MQLEKTENTNKEALSGVQPNVPALYCKSPERRQRTTRLVVAVVTYHGVMSRRFYCGARCSILECVALGQPDNNMEHCGSFVIDPAKRIIAQALGVTLLYVPIW